MERKRKGKPKQGKEIKEKKYGETTTNTSFKAHVELLNHARSHCRYNKR